MRSMYLMLSATVFAIFFNDHVAYMKPLTAELLVTKIMLGVLVTISMFSYATIIDIISVMH